jgi:hypothetical protein
MATKGIVQTIQSLIPPNGVRPWWQRVTPKQAAMLEEILAAWKSGALGSRRRTAARAIATGLASEGISIGEQGVETWLRRS